MNQYVRVTEIVVSCHQKASISKETYVTGNNHISLEGFFIKIFSNQIDSSLSKVQLVSYEFSLLFHSPYLVTYDIQSTFFFYILIHPIFKKQYNETVEVRMYISQCCLYMRTHTMTDCFCREQKNQTSLIQIEVYMKNRFYWNVVNVNHIKLSFIADKMSP